MRFYVPVGPRGVVFRVGMVATRAMGSLTYWYGSRRRSACPTVLPSYPFAHAEAASAEPHIPIGHTAQLGRHQPGLVIATEAHRMKFSKRRR